MDWIHPLFKWLHIFAGVMWIGLLYFFNFVNGAFAATMDGDTKQKVDMSQMIRLWSNKDKVRRVNLSQYQLSK